MIHPSSFLNTIKSLGVTFFTGVPDSLLKEFCACIDTEESAENHIINVNEGGAVALAIGYHLATGNTPLVYLQNSGLGNTINPLLSLADDKVYSTPMVLMIGWRGEPGVKDEPQHIKQGAVQNDILKAMDIDYEIIDHSCIDTYSSTIEKLINTANRKSKPVALIVKKNTFEEYTNKKTAVKPPFSLVREHALKILLAELEPNAIVVSTTGKTSREIFEIRKENNESNEKDFLTVGGMGHCSQIALGIALQKPERPVYCFDGDGAFLMHMGANALIGEIAPKNFKHILLNNGAHESVGGQPTVGFDINMPEIAKNCNYNNAFIASNETELTTGIEKLKNAEGPSILEVRLKVGSRKNLGRPTKTPLENKEAFMNWVKK